MIVVMNKIEEKLWGRATGLARLIPGCWHSPEQ